jgi:hypothetical protein
MKARLLGGGVHQYKGKNIGRGCRQLSKIRKGIKRLDMTLVFKKLENEKEKN